MAKDNGPKLTHCKSANAAWALMHYGRETSTIDILRVVEQLPAIPCQCTGFRMAARTANLLMDQPRDPFDMATKFPFSTRRARAQLHDTGQ